MTILLMSVVELGERRAEGESDRQKTLKQLLNNVSKEQGSFLENLKLLH